jgi:hypothetical protein
MQPLTVISHRFAVDCHGTIYKPFEGQNKTPLVLTEIFFLEEQNKTPVLW